MALIKRTVDRIIGNFFDDLVHLAGTRSVAESIENQMKQNAPWKDRTGEARRSLFTKVKTIRRKKKLTINLELGGTAEHIVFLEDGTRPHRIVAVNKKALFWPGAAHPVKAVNHPGSRPFPIIKPTGIKTFNKIVRATPRLWRANV